MSLTLETAGSLPNLSYLDLKSAILSNQSVNSNMASIGVTATTGNNKPSKRKIKKETSPVETPITHTSSPETQPSGTVESEERDAYESPHVKELQK